MDEHPPSSTLFLHEDILAWTLAYEQDMQQWWIAELEAGRGDPSRPTYEEVSGCVNSLLSYLTSASGVQWPTNHTTLLPWRREPSSFPKEQ